MSDSGKNLSPMSNEPRSREINGVVFPVSPLKIGDFVDMEVFIQNRRFNDTVKRLERIPYSDAVVADLLSRVQNANVEQDEILRNESARVELVKRSVKHGGGDPNTVSDLSPGGFLKLWSCVMHSSGYGGTDDPFVDTDEPPPKSTD